MVQGHHQAISGAKASQLLDSEHEHGGIRRRAECDRPKAGT